MLVHGFTSNRNENWRRLGWYGAFERKHIRCIALDCRGHGESAKPHDSAAYGRIAMANDIMALLRSSECRARRSDGLFDGSESGPCLSLGTAETSSAADSGRRRREIAGGEACRQCDGGSYGSRGPGNHHRPDAAQLSPLSQTSRARTGWRSPPLNRAPNERFGRETLATLSMPVLVVAGARDRDSRAIRATGRCHSRRAGGRPCPAAIIFLRHRPRAHQGGGVRFPRRDAGNSYCVKDTPPPRIRGAA